MLSLCAHRAVGGRGWAKPSCIHHCGGGAGQAAQQHQVPSSIFVSWAECKESDGSKSPHLDGCRACKLPRPPPSVFIHGGVSTPYELTDAMPKVAAALSLENVETFHIHTSGDAKYSKDPRFKSVCSPPPCGRPAVPAVLLLLSLHCVP